jgi:hypothetical protein
MTIYLKSIGFNFDIAGVARAEFNAFPKNILNLKATVLEIAQGRKTTVKVMMTAKDIPLRAND